MSPLAARSRIREVVQALTGARGSWRAVVLEGKTLLHVAGELPGLWCRWRLCRWRRRWRWLGS